MFRQHDAAAKHVRRIQGLHRFISAIKEAPSVLEEKQCVDEELLKIEKVFGSDSSRRRKLDSYDNIKNAWKLLFIALLGYDVRDAIGYLKCIEFIQSAHFGLNRVGYIGIALFSSFPVMCERIIRSTAFIDTLKGHLSTQRTNTEDVHSARAICALRCIANLCHIDREFSDHFTDSVEALCFTADRENTEMCKKALMAMSKLVSVNEDYLMDIAQRKPQIEALISHSDQGVVNSALCLLDRMLSKRHSLRKRQIDRIVNGYLREVQTAMRTVHMAGSIMTYLPSSVVELCRAMYNGPPNEYCALLPSIVRQLSNLGASNVSAAFTHNVDQKYWYHGVPNPWVCVHVVKNESLAKCVDRRR